MKHKVTGTSQPSLVVELQQAFPVKTEVELKNLSQDELKSIAAKAYQLVSAYQAEAQENPLVGSILKLHKQLSVNFDQLSKDDLVQYALAVLALVAQATAQGEIVKVQDGNATAGLGQELNNIDFNKMIGGPLQAVVQAQAASALTTIEFIKEVGFERDSSGNITGVRNVTFKYDKVTGQDENGNDIKVLKDVTVPLLSMINVPTLRIQDVDIAFNAKLNSVESKEVKTSLGITAELGIKYAFINLKVSGSYQRSTTSGIKVEREYTLGVKVKATQDEIPAGLEKVLNLLAA